MDHWSTPTPRQRRWIQLRDADQHQRPGRYSGQLTIQPRRGGAPVDGGTASVGRSPPPPPRRGGGLTAGPGFVSVSAAHGLTVRVKVHVPESPFVSLLPPVTAYVPGASEVEAVITPVEPTTT